MVAHTCNFSIQAAETGESWVQGQCEVCRETLSPKTK
jgi:hypothetical protein